MRMGHFLGAFVKVSPPSLSRHTFERPDELFKKRKGYMKAEGPGDGGGDFGIDFRWQG